MLNQVFNVGDLVIHVDDQKEHKTVGVVSNIERDDSHFGDIIEVDWLNNNGDYRFRIRQYRACAIAKVNEVTLA